MNEWVALHPARFVDRRLRFTRDSGLVYQNVGAYRAVVMRRGEDGKQETERCPHAHNKFSAAAKCGEQTARRWNREARKEAS